VGAPYFLAREREKWYKILSFDPYRAKHSKNRSNDQLGPFFGTLFLLFAFFTMFAIFWTFLVILLPNKASDERVGGRLFFERRRVAPSLLILTRCELCGLAIVKILYSKPYGKRCVIGQSISRLIRALNYPFPPGKVDGKEEEEVVVSSLDK
jgi:hypothetical protein